MYVQNQLLFPAEVIPVVERSRGAEWAALVQQVKELPDCHAGKLGFCLLMIRVNGCLECETDSYRAMRGCDECSLQTLRRFHGTDCDLLNMYQCAQSEVTGYLQLTQAQAA